MSTQASFLVEKVVPIVMREIGPHISSRITPLIAEKVGLPLAKKVGLPLAKRIGIPIARKAGSVFINKVGYPLVKKVLFKDKINSPAAGKPEAAQPGNNASTVLPVKIDPAFEQTKKHRGIKGLISAGKTKIKAPPSPNNINTMSPPLSARPVSPVSPVAPQMQTPVPPGYTGTANQNSYPFYYGNTNPFRKRKTLNYE